MSTNDDMPLLSSATLATQRTADVAAIKNALNELHNGIFGSVPPADATHETLLRQISGARSVLNKVAVTSRTGLDTERLLLDAVLTLGEMLASAAAGQRIRSKVVKRLEDVVLPVLFIRSNVTPQLLKTHALKTPWAVFETARQRPNDEVEKMELTFASWKANHGWGFPTRKERCHVASEAIAPASVTTKVIVEMKQASRVGGTPDQQRPVLRDIAWNAALRRTAGAGIPSYLLTKRRRVDGHPSSTCNASLPPDVSRVVTAPSHIPHATIDPIDDSTGSIVLALKSPVRRRRLDINLGIPPSPDRPRRCL
ncbi:hypothetical protein ABB37_10052 [Leptomonas pyrrhocoris]|uniref:Uncharacterized protein n=1 Tax=Leptomonas pyrrhocoris TaxID=157538 RepID=A0A0M9FPC2_LEPPY|nr:hypothetical protein ABB37_10052 [Leptomonas pyrrhocoris]KPA73233.1 hypothetical protein ABB37_10052 [Leptomonas pyrrhocoris]|eukprot:XP_015651672.1 hypothetical protein ABB37_10052 [Leptomonas pyrrhocoris]